jgi:putative transposase
VTGIWPALARGDGRRRRLLRAAVARPRVRWRYRRATTPPLALPVGLPPQRYRHPVLGLQATSAEDGAGWLGFFRDLTARGLTGVRLVTSDSHRGLVAAIGATLPGAGWQRCRTHYAANLMSATPKASWPWVRAMLHSVYDQPDSASVHAQYDRLLEAVHDKLPKIAEHLDAARADVLAFTSFPKEVWRQIWSNNPCLNREIRRRTDVVGIFPENALIRLVGAVVAEQHDEWTEGRRYLGLDVLARSRMTVVPDPTNAATPTAAAR